MDMENVCKSVQTPTALPMGAKMQERVTQTLENVCTALQSLMVPTAVTTLMEFVVVERVLPAVLVSLALLKMSAKLLVIVHTATATAIQTLPMELHAKLAAAIVMDMVSASTTARA